MPRLHVWAVGLAVVPSVMYGVQETYRHRISALADSERLLETKHQSRLMLETDLQALDGKYHNHQDTSDLILGGGSGDAAMQRSMGRYHRILNRAEQIRASEETTRNAQLARTHNNNSGGVEVGEEPLCPISRSIEQALEEEDAAMLREEQLTYLPRRMQRAVLKQMLAILEGRDEVSGAAVKVTLSMGGPATAVHPIDTTTTATPGSHSRWSLIGTSKWATSLADNIRIKLDTEATDKHTFKTAYDLPPPSECSPQTNSEKLAVFNQIQYLRWVVLEGYRKAGGGTPLGSGDTDALPPSSSSPWEKVVNQSNAQSTFSPSTDPLLLTDRARESILSKLASIEVQKLLPNMNSIHELLAVDHGGHTGALLSEDDDDENASKGSMVADTGPGVMGLSSTATLLNSAGMTSILRRNLLSSTSGGDGGSMELKDGPTTRHTFSDVFVLPKEAVDHFVAGTLMGATGSSLLYRSPILPLEYALLPPRQLGAPPISTYFGNILTASDISTRIFQVHRGGGDASRGSGTFSYVPLDRSASGSIKERSQQLPMPTQDSRLQGSIGNGISSVPEMMPSSLLPVHPKAPFALVQPIVSHLAATSANNKDGSGGEDEQAVEWDGGAQRVGRRTTPRTLPASLNASSITVFPTYQWLRSTVVDLALDMKNTGDSTGRGGGGDTTSSTPPSNHLPRSLLLPAIFRDTEGSSRVGSPFFPMERNLSFTRLFGAVNGFLSRKAVSTSAAAPPTGEYGRWMVGLAPLDIVYRDGASSSSTVPVTSKKVALLDGDTDDADRHPAHTNNTSPYYKCILSPYLRFREGALTVDEEAKSVLAYCVYAAVMHGIVPLHRIMTDRRRDHHSEEDICSSFARSEMVLSSLFQAPYHSCGVVMDPATMLHSHRIQDGKQRMEFYPFIQRRSVHGSLLQFLSGVCRDSTDNTITARTTAATLAFADASSSAHTVTSRITSLISRAKKAVLYECASTAAVALYDVVGPSASSRQQVRRSVVSTVVSGLSWGAVVGVWTCLRLCLRLMKAALVDAPTCAITSLLRTSSSSHPPTNHDADGRERELIKTMVGGCPSSFLKRWAVSYCIPSPIDMQDNLAADVPALFDLHEDAAHSMVVCDALLDAALSYYSHSLPRLVRLCALPFLLPAPSSSNDCTPVLGAMATPAFLVKASSKYVMEVLLEIDVLMYVGTDRSSWRDPTWPRRKLLFSDADEDRGASLVHKKSITNRLPPARVAASTVSELLALGGSYLPGRDVARIEGRIATMLNTPNTTTVEVNEEGVQFAENSFREHQVAAYIKEESGGALTSHPALYTINGRSATNSLPVGCGADGASTSQRWLSRQDRAFINRSLLAGCVEDGDVVRLAFTPQLWVEEVGLHAALPLPPLRITTPPPATSTAVEPSLSQTSPFTFKVDVLPGVGTAALFDRFLHSRNVTSLTATSAPLGTSSVPVSTLGLVSGSESTSPLARSDLFPIGRGGDDSRVPLFGYSLLPSPDAVFDVRCGPPYVDVHGNESTSISMIRVSPVVCAGIHRCVHVDPTGLNHDQDVGLPSTTASTRLQLPFALDPLAPPSTATPIDAAASSAATASMLLIEGALNAALGRYHILGGRERGSSPFAFVLPDVRLRPGRASYSKGSIPAGFIDTYFNPTNQGGGGDVVWVPTEDTTGTPLLSIPKVAVEAPVHKPHGALGSKSRKLFDDDGSSVEKATPQPQVHQQPLTTRKASIHNPHQPPHPTSDPNQRSVELRSWFLGRMLPAGYLDMVQGQSSNRTAPLFDRLFPTTGPVARRALLGIAPLPHSEPPHLSSSPWSALMTFNRLFAGRVFGGPLPSVYADARKVASTRQTARLETTRALLRADHEEELQVLAAAAGETTTTPHTQQSPRAAPSSSVTRRAVVSQGSSQRREVSFMVMAPCDFTPNTAIPATTLEHIAQVVRGQVVLNSLVARSENGRGAECAFIN